MSENAQATSVAGAPAARNGENGRGEALREGRPRPDRRHRRGRRAHGRGHRALGRAALRRHGADRHAQPGLVGPLHHHVHVLRGPLRRRPRSSRRCRKAFGMQGLRRHLQGGRRGRPSAAPCSPSASWWWTWGSPARLWELFAYSEPGLAAHVGHHRAGRLPDPVRACTCGPTLRSESGKGVGRAALRVVSVVRARVRRPGALGDRLDLRPAAERTRCWHTALLAPWFVSSALVCGTGAGACGGHRACAGAATSRSDQANIVKLAKLLGAFVRGGPVLLRLRPA